MFRRNRRMGCFTKIILIALIVFGYRYAMSPKEINVEYISQYPELKNGCEVASLNMALSHYNIYTNKTVIARDFLKKTNIEGGNPDEAYLGDPFGRGYYCYAKPLVEAANAYLKDKGLQNKYYAVDETKMFPIKIKTYIDKNIPIVMWSTTDYGPLRKNGLKWKMNNSQIHEAYSNSHCFLVTGYTPTSIIVMDPITGRQEINMFKFIKMYINTGRKAMVVIPY